jgi:hypothetical protein
MKRGSSTCFLLLIISLAAPAWAQVFGSLVGTVRDKSTAVIPGAEITATQRETGIKLYTSRQFHWRLRFRTSSDRRLNRHL